MIRDPWINEPAPDESYSDWLIRTNRCGIDMEPTEPGRYVCEEFKRLPHHSCGLHHDPEKITCEATEAMMAIDQEMMGWAN